MPPGGRRGHRVDREHRAVRRTLDAAAGPRLRRPRTAHPVRRARRRDDTRPALRRRRHRDVHPAGGHTGAALTGPGAVGDRPGGVGPPEAGSRTLYNMAGDFLLKPHRRSQFLPKQSRIIGFAFTRENCEKLFGGEHLFRDGTEPHRGPVLSHSSLHHIVHKLIAIHNTDVLSRI